MRHRPSTIVVALGGNALAPPGHRAGIAEQFAHTRESLHAIVDLAGDGWRIAIVHGNGTQVGDELERNELARAEVEPLPLGVLVAATAGWIGYMIQQSLQNALERAGIDRPVVTLVTQTLVATPGGGHTRPQKPVGHAFDAARAASLEAMGVPVGRDARGRYRRMAPTPQPIGVVEAAVVKQLVLEGKIVIAGGGGGPPVYRDAAKGWEGVDAVVDKDRVAAIMAHALDADTLLLLTDVPGVFRAWGSEGAHRLARLNLAEAEQLVRSGELGEGSMLPKVEAAVDFVRGGGRRAIIAHLADGPSALRGETGTTIERAAE